MQAMAAPLDLDALVRPIEEAPDKRAAMKAAWEVLREAKLIVRSWIGPVADLQDEIKGLFALIDAVMWAAGLSVSQRSNAVNGAARSVGCEGILVIQGLIERGQVSLK